MDHARAQALKVCAILALVPLSQGQERGATDILIQARDRLLAETERRPKIDCTQTIDRGYFSRVTPPDRKLSCDQIAVDRKKARYRLKLDATDRIRLKISSVGGQERLSWVDALRFESHDLEEVLVTGPIGTGMLGGYLTGLFGDPESRFQYLGEKNGKIEYGFRESAESSGHVVKAGDRWLPTAHTGSFVIDSELLDPEHLTIETSTLPPETAMCESEISVDYHRVRIGVEDVLLPRRAESHDIMASAQETTSVIVYSSCVAESGPAELPSKAASILPENYKIRLALDDPIDSQTAAAGDPVSASVLGDVVAREGVKFRTLLHRGTRVRGRILSLGLYPEFDRLGRPAVPPENHLLVAISFDMAEIDGVASPLHVRLDRVGLTSAGSRWPENTLVFSTTDKYYVVRRGFESTWISMK
jgi:hypothetical protein